MKMAVLFLLTIASTHLYAENFPTNIELLAEVSMTEYLESNNELINVQISKVQFLDMDPFAEYYLRIDWSYTDLAQKELSCYSNVALSAMAGAPQDFSELSRSCK